MTLDVATILTVIVIPALLTLIIGDKFKAYKNKKTEDGAIKDALCAVMRHLIVVSHDSAMEKEYVSQLEMSSVSAMYDCYARLGQNGYVTDLVSEMKKLPQSAKTENKTQEV